MFRCFDTISTRLYCTLTNDVMIVYFVYLPSRELGTVVFIYVIYLSSNVEFNYDGITSEL